ncbi:MAG TPA: hypothetical protein VMV29_10375 [Ktedonobacterales bacterium]|nr:hypothetical protein [Ktedonobacterales bacterium]
MFGLHSAIASHDTPIVSQGCANANPANVNLLTPAEEVALRMRYVGTVAPLIR